LAAAAARPYQVIRLCLPSAPPAAGIACRPIGPIVYYSGFTRAFLAGVTESSAEGETQ